MKLYLISTLLMIFLTGCTSQNGILDKGSYKIDTRHQAEATSPRVKILVIHYTAEDFNDSLSILTHQQVSAHYLIPEQPPQSGDKPIIWQLVPESEQAWHAGASSWRGATHINTNSVGIELENKGMTRQGDKMEFYPFSEAQIGVLASLAKDIIARYHIAPQNVVAHGDIAPQRKMDPGPLFPWHRLFEQGIGAWPDASRVDFYLQNRNPYSAVPTADLLALLARYGYSVEKNSSAEQQRRVIAAFQMHFRPTQYNGIADAQTQALVEALLEKYGEDN